MGQNYNTITGRLKKLDRRRLDDLFHRTHREVFEDFDCLSCAGCCKTIPPAIQDADIRRISRFLKMKPVRFTEMYVTTDDEGDQVFNALPCTFLEPDNTCRIYSHRPVACAGYPHTDRPRMYQLLNLTAKNAEVCPAVRLILEKIASL
jgi:uncharacterized protein